ncbi:leucyl aminopeptidase [Curtobacterium flaccumfaciens pv. flaccumfaciens]|uniref:leucyl aminopeptidase n=1 Tax=Curtobacterium flaccumfaciens TaxID=2035 RepID=UPI00217D3A48|nr:leucyl aminopeptidase [Curtobacterium flaccumfaciens]MCS6567739.1 leucyl aminopeptidase [Curtobacterium flaccumfaciens pv. flaccumfaciens]MCS6585821.1 leucyl aminopeptidase [Curtobacterium flaccumfaciens pv. flaccumfaciens]UXN22313.1 leucyl aminopeptidase [Curtobacterium flaccumfaciens pv. flaccumfaciens]
MVRPTLSTTSSPPETTTADVLVVGVRPGSSGEADSPAVLAPTALGTLDALAGLDLAAIGVTGAKDQLVRLPATGVGAKSVALIGLGSATGAAAIRAAAGSAVRQLPRVDSITLALPTDSAELVDAALEGAALGAYAFTRHKGTGTKAPARGDQRIEVVAAADVADAAVRPAIVADAASLVRDLVNTAAGDLGPQDVADVATGFASDLPLTVEVLDEQALEEQGFGGILGVGRGSARPPRLVVVRYAPESATKHLALVGKGITFDSGGLSLKPAASMLGMKTDMTGAATVLAATVAAARLGLNVRVTAWLALAENMPSGTATRPGDVLTLKNGTTVEVTNTDAEGRLVLGDGMAAASLEEPDALVDVATLTGAQVVALGDRTTGLMGSDDLVAKVRAVAEGVAEPIWPMPLPEELEARLSSDVADIVNATVGNPAGGMLLAGKFLERFAGEGVPWAHLDIAGPSENKGGGYAWLGKGATGVMVRTLIALAEDLQSE